jgi:hypothetical protein
MMDGSPIRVPEGAIVDLEWMFAEPARVELGRLNAEIDRWIIGAETSPDYAVILADKPEMTPPRVFGRGNPANPGPTVPRQFLELLSGSGSASHSPTAAVGEKWPRPSRVPTIPSPHGFS